MTPTTLSVTIPRAGAQALEQALWQGYIFPTTEAGV